ncbi:MAG: hypothetical protein PF904_03100 [Kiritimatiellae bacterium]|jgi:hypothetical protein|nr:hypothetical protein [Kiritimatiellia bacterium]
MDEVTQDGKIPDATTNNIDLTLGSGCWLTNGIAGSALHFNGTADAWSSFFGPAMGSRTVSLLFRREEENGPLYEGKPDTYPYIIAELSTMRIHFATANDINLVYVAGRPLSGLGNFPRGQWNHMAWVYEEAATGEPNVVNGNCKLYLNGILNSTSPTYTLTNTAAAGTAYLGNHINKSRPIYGELDEVKIYSTALTEEQVMLEALRGMETGKTPRLLGHWTMEEIIETNSTRLIRDLSGNNYDLQLDDGCQLTNGIDGMALNYDGTTNASAYFADGPKVSSWSFAGWVRQDRASETPVIEGNHYPRILVSSPGGLMMHLKDDNNYMTFQNYGSTSAQNHLVRPDTGVWAHYAVVTRMAYNTGSNTFSSIPEFYVNGQKVSDGIEKVTGILVWNLDYNMFVGNNALNGSRAFMGEFDNFRFYDGALTEAQIAEIYQGLPSVSAGADFNTASGTVALQGVIDGKNDNPLRLGSSAEVTWTLVSAPAGGEAAAIETPASTVTKATLPVIGTYVFRLTAHNYEHSVSDEVTISRMAAPVGNVPPTVTLNATASVEMPTSLSLNAITSDTDGVLGTLQVAWTKVSGPGGVYFDDSSAPATETTFLAAGSYLLRCTANDGAATDAADITVTVTGDSSTTSLTNGLVRYYPMNSTPYDEEVISGSTAMSFTDLETGIVGYGLRTYGANGYASTGLSLPEYGVENQPVTNPTHLAFSLWMYHDTADTNVCADAALLHVSYSLGIYYRCQNPSPGFILFQQGVSGKVTQYFFPGPAVSPTNRWTHVYACFDRAGGSELELYIDGTKQTKSSSSGSSPARIRPDTLKIGGMTQTSGGTQGAITNSISGGFYSRVFPGILDEVRIYNHALTTAEVMALVAQPIRINREPLPELDTELIVGNKGDIKPLEAIIYDDGLPMGVSLESHWTIVSGNSEGISIADDSSSSTTISLLELGTYGLQLETTDGERVSYSEIISVIVNPGGTLILLR